MPMSKKCKSEYNKRYYRGHKLSILKSIQIPTLGVVKPKPEIDADGNPMPEYE